MTTQPQWYAVYTKPKWEKKVAELLRRRKIEAYCPLNKPATQFDHRKKIVEEPLFTSYVFVRITKEEVEAVRKTDGVVNFAYWLGQPAVIREEEIAAIQEFLAVHKNTKLEKTTVKPNAFAEIQKASQVNRQSRVLEAYNKTIKVELPSLGYNLTAEVEKASVEIIQISHQLARAISVA